MTSLIARKKVVIGSRASALSRAQTDEVACRLRQAHPGIVVHTVTLSTRGDRNKSAPLLSMERGMFVKEIEAALLNGEIDIAVHSAKDMPTAMPEGLVVAAYTEREDARDVLVNRWGLKLYELPQGARLGTSSPRRIAQLKAVRPDLQYPPVRGNVDTRIRKAQGADYDGVVLAAAGIIRLGRAAEISAFISPQLCVPDVGQGALAVQVRASDEAMRELVGTIDHQITAEAVRAERTFLMAMGGGCTVPTAAYATIQGDELHLTAMVANPDGCRLIRIVRAYERSQPEAAGRAVARAMMRQGAGEILSDKGVRHGNSDDAE